MPRYSLRTLIAVMLVGGPALAGIWRLLVSIPGLAFAVGLAVGVIAVVFAGAWVVELQERPDREYERADGIDDDPGQRTGTNP
jgi:hypothetical protein